MPRNGSGTYSLPSGNPVVPGTTIEATWANNTLSDIGSAVTHSLSRNGEGAMLAALRVVDGTITAPGLAFSSETNSGFYRTGTTTVRLAIGGSYTMEYSSSGVTVASGKTLAVTSNATVGGTLGVTGAATLSSTLGVTGAATLSSTLAVTGASTLTGSASFGSAITETVYALSGTQLNAANGTIQTKTLAANTTFTEALSAGQSLVLMLGAGASYTVTWPTITWVTASGNVAPTLTAADTLVFWKVGTTLYGAVVGSYA